MAIGRSGLVLSVTDKKTRILGISSTSSDSHEKIIFGASADNNEPVQEDYNLKHDFQWITSSRHCCVAIICSNVPRRVVCGDPQ